MEDTMSEIAQGTEGSLQAKIVLLEKELERTKQYHEQQINELRRTTELMRIGMENEKTRLVNEVRKQCEAERLRSIDETKRKTWCVQCRREANLYCCWNTSYCGYPCQQLHWSKHATHCAQTRTTTAVESSSSNAGSSMTHEVGNILIRKFPMKCLQYFLSFLFLKQRHQSKSTNTSSSVNTPATFNTKSSISSLSMGHAKKEKVLVKSSSSNNMMAASSATSSSPLSTARSNNPQSTEVLKLPSNTYLRPVATASLTSQTLRCNTTYSIPVQRFNVPVSNLCNCLFNT